MPHIIAEYTASLEPKLDPQKLLADLHAAAASTNLFDVMTIRARAIRHSQFLVADGKAGNGFIHITARLRGGRTFEERKSLGETLLAAATLSLAEVFSSHAVIMNVEVQEIVPEMIFRKSTI